MSHVTVTPLGISNTLGKQRGRTHGKRTMKLKGADGLVAVAGKAVVKRLAGGWRSSSVLGAER